MATASREPAHATREMKNDPMQTPLDRIEISEMGQTLSTLSPDSGIRVDKVAEIREAILSGTYMTEEKIDVTVNQLLETLRSSSDV